MKNLELPKIQNLPAQLNLAERYTSKLVMPVVTEIPALGEN